MDCGDRRLCQSKVVKVFDGVKDNAPFSMNMEAPSGNAVVIKHLEEEYSLLASLQEGFHSCKEGMDVELGDLIAKSGNAGGDTPICIFTLWIQKIMRRRGRYVSNLES